MLPDSSVNICVFLCVGPVWCDCLYVWPFIFNPACTGVMGSQSGSCLSLLSGVWSQCQHWGLRIETPSCCFVVWSLEPSLPVFFFFIFSFFLTFFFKCNQKVHDWRQLSRECLNIGMHAWINTVSPDMANHSHFSCTDQSNNMQWSLLA